ncbi:MAG: hypothetical protein ACREOJ_12685 [Gemmatimonadaceae bacterium]
MPFPSAESEQRQTASHDARQLLRHTVATLAYRGGKAVANAPEEFAALRIGATTRTPAEILAHVGDLLDWALWQARGEHRWHDSPPQPWPRNVQRFFDALARLDEYLASDAPLGTGAGVIFQGPIADALTHVGQLTMLRRLAGSPVRGENYAKAEIRIGRVGAEQSARRVEFD